MRLIDADALRSELESWGMNDYEPLDFIDAIDDAPTIEVISKLEDIYEELRQEYEDYSARDYYDTAYGLYGAMGIVKKHMESENNKMRLIDDAPTLDVLTRQQADIIRQALPDLKKDIDEIITMKDTFIYHLVMDAIERKIREVEKAMRNE